MVGVGVAGFADGGFGAEEPEGLAAGAAAGLGAVAAGLAVGAADGLGAAPEGLAAGAAAGFAAGAEAPLDGLTAEEPVICLALANA